MPDWPLPRAVELPNGKPLFKREPATPFELIPATYNVHPEKEGDTCCRCFDIVFFDEMHHWIGKQPIHKHCLEIYLIGE